MKDSKKEILYFCMAYSSFVKKDISFFENEYSVKSFLFSVKNKYLVPFSFLNQFFFIFINIFRADIVVCQFAGYHSFLPVFFAKLFFKPSLIILGGTDCVGFPSIRYGNFQKIFLSKFTRWSCRLTTHLSPVHESLMNYNYTYQNKDFPKQGLFFFYPALKIPYTVIYNGYDEKKWYKNAGKKRNTFITVAADLKMKFSVPLKGIDLLLEAAPLFPDCEFLIIGADAAVQLPVQSQNVKLLPPVNNEQLIRYYSESEFYLQLSMSEGFPNALCEAMLCECIPVVSNVGAMPEIVEEVGFILKNKDILQLKKLIEKALLSDRNALSKMARVRIQERYPETLRKEKLLALMAKMIKDGNN